jgi:hypothetical protein
MLNNLYATNAGFKATDFYGLIQTLLNTSIMCIFRVARITAIPGRNRLMRFDRDNDTITGTLPAAALSHLIRTDFAGDDNNLLEVCRNNDLTGDQSVNKQGASLTPAKPPNGAQLLETAIQW